MDLPQPNYVAALGDDLDVSFSQRVSLKKIFSGYEKLLFNIAASKTRVSVGTNASTEFLWLSYTIVNGV